jgi:hypothetical protein
MVELVTRMMELKKQQARAPKKQSPSAKQLLDQKLAITDGRKEGHFPIFRSEARQGRTVIRVHRQ